MTKIAMRFVTTTDIPIGDALVAIRLTRSDYEEKTSGVLMPRLEEFHTDADGFLQVDLMPATHLYHVTVYDTVQDIAIHHDFIVPEVEDPNTVLLLPDLIVPPDTVLSSFPFDEEALAKIIQAKVEAVAAALQSQASAATAVAAIDTVKADADKVEAWTATVDQQHTEVGGWTIQAAQNKTAVDAAVIVVNQDKVAAVNAAAGAKTSETNAANHAATASTDSLSATASKTAAAASAYAASGSQTAAANSATSALASQASATQSASTATTAKNESLSYRDQANQSAQDALASKNSATASATSATAAKDSATASASASLTNATNAANSAIAAATSAAQAQASNNAATTSAANAYESARVANVAATASQNSATASQNSAAASAQSAADAANATVNKLDKADAVVVPAADKVPRAAANGRIDPAWIDKTIPLQSEKVIATSSLTVAVSGTPGQEVLRLSVASGAEGIARTVIKMGYPADGYGTRMISGGDPTIGYSGYTSFETGDGPSGYLERMRIANDGKVLIGQAAATDSELLQVAGAGRFTLTGQEADLLFSASLKGSQGSLVLLAGDGSPYSAPASVLYIGKNSNTGRGITTPGNVNTMGNDYAEYIFKCLLCGLIAKGQIVGITADNTITDQWADAIMFSIKSTAPSYVGGDSWANAAGPRPVPQAGQVPTLPPRRIEEVTQEVVPNTNPPKYREVVTPGDTDAEWAVKQAAYATAMAAHEVSVQQDAEALAKFEEALEVERQKVDRIAIAGRVPVNVFGATPGDYIIPVQDGDGIKGIAVKEDDMTLRQYLRAVGQVISIEDDGRAYVMVKAV